MEKQTAIVTIVHNFHGKQDTLNQQERDEMLDQIDLFVESESMQQLLKEGVETNVTIKPKGDHRLDAFNNEIDNGRNNKYDHQDTAK